MLLPPASSMGSKHHLFVFLIYSLEGGIRIRMIRRSSTVAAHSHLPLFTKSLSVREFTPSEETVEACKARIGRIVGKQKKCYCTIPDFSTEMKPKSRWNVLSGWTKISFIN